MAGPIITGAVFSLVLIVLSIVKPNAGRIFLGVFFLVMGIGVNGTYLFTQPSFVFDYGYNAQFALYRSLTESIIGPAPLAFGIILIVFEVTMGIFLLSRGRLVKIGLIGAMAFVLMLVPIHYAQAVWAVSIGANIYLLTKHFNEGLLKMIKTRFKSRGKTGSRE